jgi:hypothetical protein
MMSRSHKSGQANGAEKSEGTHAQQKCLTIETRLYKPLVLNCTDPHDKSTFFPELPKNS